MVDNYSSVNVEPRGQRSEDKGQILYLLTSVSIAWYLVIEMSHRWRSFSSFLREVSVIVRLLTLLAESDLEWILALWTVCVCVGVKRWEYERMRERRRTVACWTVMNSYDWQSMSNPLKSHCLQNRAHALSNIQHPMMFLIACHLEGAWNLKTLMRKIQLCITYTGIIVFKNVEALYLPPQKLLLNWFLLACLDLFLTRWWEPP